MADNRVQITIAALDQTKAAFESVRNSFRNLDSQARSSATSISAEWKKVGATIASAFSAYQVVSFLKSTIDVAEKTENTLRGLGAVARYAGEDLGATMQAASKLASDGLLDVSEASKALQNLLSRGFSLQESVEMINRLKDAAAFNRQSHLTMAQAVESATEGIKNENSVLVDNAGVTKNVSQMWKEYAASIGKGVNQLTQAEKRQAEYNGILKETEAQMGNADLAAKGLTGTKQKLTTEVNNLKNAIGQSLIPAFVELAKWANWAMKEAIIPFMSSIEIMSTKSAAFFEKIKAQKELRRLQGAAMWNDEDPARSQRISELEARLKMLDLTKEEQIQDIKKKYAGYLDAPELGKDSGKRRQDSPAAPGTSSKKETAAKKAADAMKRLNEQADEFIRKNRQELELAGLDGLNKKLRENEIKYEDAVKAASKFVGAKKEEALSIAAEIKTKDDWNAKVEYSIKLGELEAKAIKEADEEKKKAKEELLAAQEAEINAQLYELDLAEQAGASWRDLLNERILLTQKLLDLQSGKLAEIDQAKDPTGYNSQSEKLNATRSTMIGLKNQNDQLVGSFADGWAKAWKDWKDNALTAFTAGQQMAQEIAQSMQNSFSTIFFDVIEGSFKSFSDYFKAFTTSLNKIFADMLAKMVTDWITSMSVMKLKEAGSSLLSLGVSLLGLGVGAMGGGGAGAASAPTLGSVGASTFAVDMSLAPTWHSGGVSGSDSPKSFRIVPSPAFFGAPRYHSGIGPGEVAAVLRQDEGVFTQGQMKNMASLSSIVGAIRNAGANGGNSLSVNVPVNVPFDNRRLIASLKREIEGTVVKVVRSYT